MKLTFIIFITSLLGLPFWWQHNNIPLTGYTIPNQYRIKPAEGDSSQSIRIISTSSLKGLPAVISDLSAALDESMFQDGLLLGKNGIAIYLYDVTCNSFEISASVRFEINDTLYYLKLNRFNQRAGDKALAVTLIHEIMHCVLLDINRRAKQSEEKALASIISFGLNNNDISNFFNNDFFILMNRDNDGQHELIYQLFYSRMVSLLERFAEIHKDPLDHMDAEHLMWSGLQKTNAYKKLGDEEKKDIEFTILDAKGIYIE